MKKTDKKEKKDKKFDFGYLLKDINPFLKAGFLNYIQGKTIKSEREFKKLYKKYGELR